MAIMEIIGIAQIVLLLLEFIKKSGFTNLISTSSSILSI